MVAEWHFEAGGGVPLVSITDQNMVEVSSFVYELSRHLVPSEDQHILPQGTGGVVVPALWNAPRHAGPEPGIRI